MSGASGSSGDKPVALFPDRFRIGGDHTTYDAHPDGRFLMVETAADRDDPYGDLFRFRIVRNWIAEVKARVPTR